MTHAQQILAVWRDNADAWSRAVRERSIESRRLVTDAAIVNAILGRRPRTVLDLGCGEGWLSHAIAHHGIRVLGVDAIQRLIDLANDGSSAARFCTMDYEAVAAGEIKEKFDLAVCNFSLFDEHAVPQLFHAVADILNDSGTFLVQTLHPVTGCGESPYCDGWREGSWQGCGNGFGEAPPWYFRTLETWQSLFAQNNLRVIDIITPVHPDTQLPVSIIFSAQSQSL